MQALETQLSKVEEEKLKLLVEVSEYKATVQTLKEELNESQHKTTHLTKEKTSLQELLKSEELIREKVRLYTTLKPGLNLIKRLGSYLGATMSFTTANSFGRLVSEKQMQSESIWIPNTM